MNAAGNDANRLITDPKREIEATSATGSTDSVAKRHRRRSTQKGFATMIEYIKALAWPTVALVFLLSFWTPLHQIMGVLPRLLQQSESISVSGVSLKVSKNIADQVSSEDKEVL